MSEVHNVILKSVKVSILLLSYLVLVTITGNVRDDFLAHSSYFLEVNHK